MSHSVASDDKVSISKELDTSVSNDARSVIDEQLLRSARWKFDLFVLPLISTFSLLAFLDRSNLGNAKTAGLMKDLKLTNHQFSVSLTITYVPYILSEIPTNLILKRVGPQRLLPFFMLCWGLVTCFQGFVTNYGGLLACRFFIGVFEGGLIPGTLLYLSAFYRRHEIHTRMSLLYAFPALAGAFSGLLAFAIIHLNNKGGKAGWRWIFFLEGGFTVIYAIIAAIFMPENVKDCRLLTAEEKEAVHAVLAQEFNDERDKEPFAWKEVWSVFTSPGMIIMIPAFFSNGLTLLGLSYYAPSIVNTLGYSPGRTQLMTVPPYAAAFVASFITGLVSDRYKARGPITIFAASLDLIGYAMFLGSTHKHTRYGALFLIVTGAYIGAPALCAWLGNNMMPHFRRGTAFALIFMWSNVAGIVSTWTFDDPPKYHKPATINLIFAVIMIAVSFIYMGFITRVNSTRAKERAAAAAEGDISEKYTEEQELEKHRLGDRHRDFVYTL